MQTQLNRTSRGSTGRVGSQVSNVLPFTPTVSSRLFSHAVAEPATSASSASTVKLPANHLESSKKALELLKEQQVNR